MLSGLVEENIPGVNYEPRGPHPVGSFEVWVPQEYLPHMLTFTMYNRGDLSVLVHPLGKTEIRDHSSDAMWLGKPFPLGEHSDAMKAKKDKNVARKILILAFACKVIIKNIKIFFQICQHCLAQEEMVPSIRN